MIRSQALLGPLAELLLLATRLPAEQQELLGTAMATAQAQLNQRSARSWQPEDVLVQAFLRIEAGEEPDRQLAWLTQDLTNRGTGHFPTAALALLHTALGDLEAAERVAALPAARHQRATVLTAVASHLARIPCRPSPLPHTAGTDPFTRAISNLALKTTPAAPPDHDTASTMLHRVMSTPTWHQALPALARLTPRTLLTRYQQAVHIGRSGNTARAVDVLTRARRGPGPRLRQPRPHQGSKPC
ncbi:hypothetical protein [Streptomyces omiyaensis]|uniref:hypothetical protein n=1 Tax=Streptomyces omiyaensis TaxID=68247 RepID=UPI0036F8B7C7